MKRFTLSKSMCTIYEGNNKYRLTIHVLTLSTCYDHKIHEHTYEQLVFTAWITAFTSFLLHVWTSEREPCCSLLPLHPPRHAECWCDNGFEIVRGCVLLCEEWVSKGLMNQQHETNIHLELKAHLHPPLFSYTVYMQIIESERHEGQRNGSKECLQSIISSHILPIFLSF